MAKCAKCGREEYSTIISIIPGKDKTAPVPWDDYNCFYCAMEELEKRLKGVPFTIQVPDYPEYTGEELIKHGAGINYIPELIDYPPRKEDAIEPVRVVVEPKEIEEPQTKLAALCERLAAARGEDWRPSFEELKDWVKKLSDQEFERELAGVSSSRALGRILSCGLPYNKQMILLRRMRRALGRLEWEVRGLKRGNLR